MSQRNGHPHFEDRGEAGRGHVKGMSHDTLMVGTCHNYGHPVTVGQREHGHTVPSP